MQNNLECPKNIIFIKQTLFSLFGWTSQGNVHVIFHPKTLSVCNDVCYVWIVAEVCSIYWTEFPLVCLTVGIVAGVHSDDPVSARGVLHPGGLHSDDRVGERKTPQLPEGVPRLSHAPLSHPSLHPVGQSRSIPLVFLTFILSSSPSSLLY